jgi:hypothetical protein
LFWKWIGFAKWYQETNFVILWFRRVWPVKHQDILYCTHMWPGGMLSWGIGTCLLGFGLKAQLFLMLWFWETKFVENVLRADCFMNPLWIVDMTYVEMIDDVYLWQLYVDGISDCIYNGELLLSVGDCIYMLSGGKLLLFAYIQVLVVLRWFVCVNICIVVESYVHAFMTDGGGFYIQLRWYDVFVASEVTTLRWLGTTCI